MSEYLFPIPGSVLRSLLDGKAKAGEQFSEKHATADLMLAMDRDDIKPLRYLAKRWGWSRNSVHRKLAELSKNALEWRNFNYNNTPVELGQSGTRLGQDGTRIGLNDNKNGNIGTHLGQDGTSVGQYRTDPELRTTDNKGLNKPKPSTKEGGSQQLPSCLESYDQVLESWNKFAPTVGLSPIRSLTAKRKAGIRQRAAKVWPIISELYEQIRKSDFLLGDNKRGWRCDFEFIWCKQDNYIKILEGNYGNTGSARRGGSKATPIGRTNVPGRSNGQNGSSGKPSRRGLLANDRYQPQSQPLPELPDDSGHTAPVH